MRTLVIGSSSSGKSEYAEAMAMKRPGKKYYIATLASNDPDSVERIARHREMRKGKGFTTVERCSDMSGLHLPGRGTALLECLGNLVANEMFAEHRVEGCAEWVADGIVNLESQCDEIIVVTNDVFADGAEYTYETMKYMKTLSEVNMFLAERFERVVEVVCGILIPLKGVFI